MPGIQLAGLASGFDWKSFIDQMQAVGRAPIDALNLEKSNNTTKTSSLTAIGTRFTDLQTSVRALKADGLFAGRSISSGNATSTWSLSAAANTAPGSYAIAVSQLATASRRTGTNDIGLGISTTDTVTGVTLASMATANPVSAGVFTVNGAQVTIALTDSLKDVFDKISTATGGTVTAGYSAADDKITLSSGSPITLGAGNDTSNFLSVARLTNNGSGTISSTSALGTVNQTAALASARLTTDITNVDGSGNGTFTINGVAISFNKTTDSLSAVMARINASSAGVTAAYDSLNDRMTLTNKGTGDLGITTSETAGGFLAAVGVGAVATTRGNNALFTVNGGSTLSSASNTLDATSHGISGLSVAITSQTTETITVANSSTNARKAIEDFIAKFNSLQSYIDDQTKITSSNGKVTTSLLADNHEIQGWASSLRGKVFEAVGGTGGTISRLESLGIDFTAGTSQLAIKDSTKLDTALRDKPTEVQAFFTTATTGFAAKIDAFTTNVLGTSGSGGSGWLFSEKNLLTKSNSSIDLQIATIQRRLDSEKQRMTDSFIAMEDVQSKMQQMQTQLSNMFK
jgi:flagellar hook-associated protein 2